MAEKSISEVMREVHLNAREHGWWDREIQLLDGVIRPNANEILSKIMLVVTELAEAVEEVRRPDFEPRVFGYKVLLSPRGWLTREEFVADQKREPGPNDKPEGFGVELADAVIRIFDLSEVLGVDLATLIELKHSYNKTRPMRHGNKRA
jgi:hypothetical protein